MRLCSIAPLLVAVLLAAAGCNKNESGKDKLPPATGTGAAPLPEIPDVSQLGKGDAGAPAQAQTTGTLVARAEVSIAPRSSGTLIEVRFDEGQPVKKGDVLFRLDSRDAALAKRSAETQLRGARLALQTQETEHKRIASLVAQNAAPRQQLDQLAAAVEAARVQIAAAQDAVAIATKGIADATVRSPISGVVLEKKLSVGEYASMAPASPVLVLQDQATLELKFRLPERALATIHRGDKVRVRIPALGVTRDATISEIAPMVDTRTRTIELTAQLDNADGALRPGQMAEVELQGPS
jgi:membrane fusion protein (multidrug efflux system)